LARSISAFSTTGAIAPTTLSVTWSCRSIVAEPTIKPVCPKMCPGGGIDELSRDAHPVCRFANTPF
jgi:hypothetical protein